jgi:hypothetical protein
MWPTTFHHCASSSQFPLQRSLLVTLLCNLLLLLLQYALNLLKTHISFISAYA